MTEIHSQDTLHFIRTHRREDVRLLALQAHRSLGGYACRHHADLWLADCQREDTCMGRKRKHTLPSPPFSGAMLLRNDSAIQGRDYKTPVGSRATEFRRE